MNLFELISRRHDSLSGERHSATSKLSYSVKQSDLPLPPLVREQLIHTLTCLNVDIVICSGEADQEIAQACVSHNALNCERTSGFVYADDSDFICMKEVPYIRMSDLPLKSNFSIVSNNNKSHDGKIKNNQSKLVVEAKVWHRADVSTSLDMTETQFIEYAIAIGNDFTAPFDRSLLHNFKLRDKVDSLDNLRRYILSQGNKYRLCSLDSKLNLAINYSRSFYELHDLESFPIDDLSDDAPLTSFESTGLRTNLQEFLISVLIKSTEVNGVNTNYVSKENIDVGNVALEYVKYILMNPTLWNVSSDKENTSGGYNIFSSVNSRQFYSLEQMLSALESPKTMQSAVSLTSSHPRIAKRTDDFLGAHLFQLTCKQLLKYLHDGLPLLDDVVAIDCLNQEVGDNMIL